MQAWKDSLDKNQYLKIKGKRVLLKIRLAVFPLVNGNSQIPYFQVLRAKPG